MVAPKKLVARSVIDSTDMEHAISRRNLLLSLPAAAMASRALGQSAKPSIPVKGFSHMTLSVTDPKRSLEFYQGLFGMPIQAYQGAAPALQIGSGRQFIFLGKVAPGGKPGINHWCVTTENFNVDRIIGDARRTRNREGRYQGAAESPRPHAWSGERRRERRNGRALRQRSRRPRMQIQDVSYCGGAGNLGEVCLAKPEPSPKKGLLAMEDISHFTIFVSDSPRAFEFYQSVFVMPVEAHQGPTPLLAVGQGGPFLTIAGGGGGRGRGGREGRSARVYSCHQSRQLPHAQLRSRQGHEDARKLRHQTARGRRARSGGPDDVLHHDAHAQSRRRARRHAGTCTSPIPMAFCFRFRT